MQQGRLHKRMWPQVRNLTELPSIFSDSFCIFLLFELLAQQETNFQPVSPPALLPRTSPTAHVTLILPNWTALKCPTCALFAECATATLHSCARWGNQWMTKGGKKKVQVRQKQRIRPSKSLTSAAAAAFSRVVRQCWAFWAIFRQVLTFDTRVKVIELVPGQPIGVENVVLMQDVAAS